MRAHRAVCSVLLPIALAACATGTQHPPANVTGPKPAQAEAAPSEALLGDRFIIPGERIGPVWLRMSLRNLTTAMGEPVTATQARLPGGQPGMTYRYPDPANPEGALLVSVLEADQSVRAIRVERSESYQAREGVRAGSSDALVRAAFGNPHARRGNNEAADYCYRSGLLVRMDGTGNVESLTVVMPGDWRLYCRAGSAP